MAFNEDSRVKIPALLHLTRLGHSYLSRKEHHLQQEETNIFKHIFIESLSRINKGYILSLGRYLGTKAEEDNGISFEEKTKHLTQQLKEQFNESDKLEQQIKENLKSIGFKISQ